MSLRSRFVSVFLRPNKWLYRIFQPSPKTIRRFVHPQAWLASALIPSIGTQIERTTFGGVPVVSFVPKNQSNSDSVIVFLHGGGYCIGSSLTTHRIGLRNLSKTTGCTCHSIEYRLAPEHPHPAALDDAISAWLDIVDANPNAKLILCGDSAGGGLSLALMMRLRDEGHKLPHGAVLFSPWTNLLCDSETFETKSKADPMLLTEAAISVAEHYAPAPIDKKNPYVSPIYGTYTGLPRTLILAGDQEILLDDSRLVGERAKAAGADFKVEIWPGMFHDWWLFGFLLPESKQCLRKVADWIRSGE